MIRIIIYITLFFSWLNIFCQSTKNIPKIFDGVFVSKYTEATSGDTIVQLIRFYENNKVISSSLTNQVINADRLKKWFNIDFYSESQNEQIYKWKKKNSSIKYKINDYTFILDLNDSINMKLSIMKNNILHRLNDVKFEPFQSKNHTYFNPFPNQLIDGDILLLEIEPYSCNNNSQKNTYRFTILNDSLIQIEYSTLQRKFISISRTKSYNSSKKVSDTFLSKNDINLNQLYELSEKPLDIYSEVIPEGLELHFYLGDIIINTSIYPINELTELKQFYNKIINDNFDTPKFSIAGSGIKYSLELIQNNIGKFIIRNIDLKNGEEFYHTQSTTSR